ncbi:uncharacterized protein LOC135950787 [Calliphora vicina]|uniref:uncharacterized protein LOC135950787 n=1 Tax=Calliphora vicina TaxID=7373 RepID=UPI00325ACA83
MDVTKRNQVVRRNKYCHNCLARTHLAQNCSSPDTCLKCALPHHTLLHPNHHQRDQPPRRSVHQRVGQRNGVSKRPNKRTQTGASKPKPLQEPTDRNQPNQKILSEAIRSLAAVLCATTKTT